jgi:hypothetical protein
MTNAPWPVDLVLHTGETLIRHDPVSASVPRQIPCLAHLYLTTRRLVFDSPPPIRHEWLGRLIRLAIALAVGPASVDFSLKHLMDTYTIRLEEIQGFHTWHPGLSSPPVILTNSGNGPSFSRLPSWSLRQHLSVSATVPPERVEHFEAVVKAWQSATGKSGQ